MEQFWQFLVITDLKATERPKNTASIRTYLTSVHEVKAKKFTYIIQINDPVLGEWRYKRLVKSLDDEKNDVHDLKEGLVMSFEIFTSRTEVK